MDLGNATFIGLMTLGFVNVLTIWKPNLDSRYKFIASVLFAFGLTFVPSDLGIIILDKAKLALEYAFAASGVYKLAQKAGGQ